MPVPNTGAERVMRIATLAIVRRPVMAMLAGSFRRLGAPCGPTGYREAYSDATIAMVASIPTAMVFRYRGARTMAMAASATTRTAAAARERVINRDRGSTTRSARRPA